MPESNTEYIDYYISGWTEEIHDDYYIEWMERWAMMTTQ